MEKIKFLIPFDDIQDGEWKLFFPFKTVYHYGQEIKFTPKRGANMIKNFGVVPDYELPINTLHQDSLGVYGCIEALRMGDEGIEWLPKFNEGAIERIKEKGYKYASPEVWLDDYQDVGGDLFDDVALGIAITPRPRLGKDTLVFSNGEWASYEEDEEDTEEIMSEVILNEEQFGELNKTIFAQAGEFFAKLLWKDEDEDISEDTQEADLQEEQESEMNEEEKQEFAEQLEAKDTQIEAKDTQILELAEQMKELEEKAQKYDEQLRLAEEKAEQARQDARKLQFTEVAKEIYGLPEMETEFADELMWLEDADDSEGKAHYNALMNVLRALGNQEKMAALFGEKGNDGDNSSEITQKIENLVAAKVKDGASVKDAYEQVFSENPELYTEYDEENTKTLRSREE